GGAIHLIVPGNLRIDGTVRADGGVGYYDIQYSGYYSGGGSGGSIWLDCGVFSGTGQLTASGGSGFANGGSSYYGGGGSGGRIALYYNSSTFSPLNIFARGGQ